MDKLLSKHGTVSLAKLKQLNKTNLQTQISNVLLAILCYTILKTDANQLLIKIWISFFILTSIVRVAILYVHQRSYKKTDHEKIIKHLKQYRYGILISGLLWTACIILFYPHGNLEHLFYLVFIIMGLTSGAFMVNSIDAISALIYPIVLLIPLAIKLSLDSSDKTFPILFGTILYFIFLIVNTRKIAQDRENYLSFNYDLIMSEKEKAISEEQYRLLLNHSPIGIVHYDMNMKISYCNKQFINIMGISEEEIKNLNLKSLKDQSPIKTAQEALQGKMTEYNGLYEMSLREKTLWVHALSSPVKDINENIIGGVTIIQDATEQKDAEDEIRKLAFYDSLTLLPNRRMFMEKIDESILLCKQTSNHGAIMFLDLDRFKSLNDTLGHDYGDLLLQKVAERLRDCVKKRDIVARFGGDEFVILLNGLDKSIVKMKQDATNVAIRILNILNEPFDLLGHHYQTSPSIGVVVFGEDDDSQEDLIKYADIAMYQAKKSGRNIVKFFDHTMQHEITQRVNIETQLQTAIKNKEFILHYQPQVNSESTTYAVEALVRWQHPTKGLIYPGDFIDIAEETGLIVEIGYQILEIAFEQLTKWQTMPKMQNIGVSINISAIQFKEDDFIERLLILVEKYQINTSLIKLEITESALLEHIENTIQNMFEIRKHGIRFSLDDFGTGYSSLNYLKKLPIDELKIDQSFVRDIIFDTSDYAIIKIVASIARSFEFNLIAEGVENKEQYKMLLALGCDRFQGYFFSRAISAQEFENMIEEDRHYPLTQ